MGKPEAPTQVASETYTQELADQLLAFEADIETAQDAKKSIYEAARETYGKRYANALKLALKIKRTDDDKKAEADAVDAEAFRILAIIDKPRAPRATRAIASAVPEVEYDRETGEITEPQSAPQAARDLTNSTQPAALGQVATIQPETANDEGEAQKVERRSPKPEDAGSIPATFANAGSSNGRTAEFDSANAGSTPAPASTLSFADRIKKLRPLCQQPDSCRSSGGKSHCYVCMKASNEAGAA
jgi:uncharacterized protein (UPF0335 family)